MLYSLVSDPGPAQFQAAQIPARRQMLQVAVVGRRVREVQRPEARKGGEALQPTDAHLCGQETQGAQVSEAFEALYPRVGHPCVLEIQVPELGQASQSPESFVPGFGVPQAKRKKLSGPGEVPETSVAHERCAEIQGRE